MRRGYKQDQVEKFERFLDDIEDLLQVVGPITTGKVWDKVGGSWPYWYISDNLNKVMQMMIAQGKAVYIRQGLWQILKPNRKKPNGLQDQEPV